MVVGPEQLPVIIGVFGQNAPPDRRRFETAHRMPIAVVRCGEMGFRDGQADAIGKTLAERAGGQLDSRCEPIFGMAGCCISR